MNKGCSLSTLWPAVHTGWSKSNRFIHAEDEPEPLCLIKSIAAELVSDSGYL